VDLRDLCLEDMSLSQTVPVLRTLPSLELRLVDRDRKREYSSPNSGEPGLGEKWKQEVFSIESNPLFNLAFLSALLEDESIGLV